MLTVALYATLAGSAGAAPPAVTVVPAGPAAPDYVELKAQPGRHLKLSAGAAAQWLVVDDCDLTPDSTGETAVFTAREPGRYRLLVTTPGGTARVAVTVGTPPPKPKPPDPPAPADPLAEELRALIAAEPEAGRRDACDKLSALYRLMAEECPKADYATAGDLNARFRTAADLMLGKALLGVRSRCGREIAAAAGGDPAAALTPAKRVELAALFGRLARAVEEASR